MQRWISTILAVVGLAGLAASAPLWAPWLLTRYTSDLGLVTTITYLGQLVLCILASAAGVLGLRHVQNSGRRRDRAGGQMRAMDPARKAAARGRVRPEKAPAAQPDQVTLYTEGGVRIVTDGALLEAGAEQGAPEAEPFDTLTCPGASLANLDLGRVRAFLKRERVRKLEEVQAGLALEEQLGRLGLVRDGVPTYGALLCFGRLPQAWIPSSVTRYIRWQGRDRQSAQVERKEFGGDLITQYEACLSVLARALGAGGGSAGGANAQERGIPLATVQEAVVNALVHRDYAHRSEHIEIDLFSDRLEVKSPGRPPLKLEKSLADAMRQPRNPLVARIFGLYGYKAEAGLGLQRIMEAMASAALPPPEFAMMADADMFRVRLSRPAPAAEEVEATAEIGTEPGLPVFSPAEPAAAPVGLPTPQPVAQPAAAMEPPAAAQVRPIPAAGTVQPKETPTPLPYPVITTPFNLPAGLPDFAGRKEEIARVRQHLRLAAGTQTEPLARRQGQSVRLVAITGMGGMGKTSLALHVAHLLANDGIFPDAQLYLDLKGTDPNPLSPTAALIALLNALLGPDPARPDDLDSLSRLWQAALHHKHALLLLDNAASAAQIRPLLPASPSTALLITSRYRFTLPGALLLDLGRLNPDDARSFLQSLVTRLDNHHADLIADACAGLPLALRIAANYLALNDDVPPDAYANLLADERARLAHLRDPGDPNLDVAATLSLSIAQLDPNTRQAWALLALCPAPFDPNAAAALWGQGSSPEDFLPLDPSSTLERLRALRNRSLVSFDPDSARYHLHDLLRLAASRLLPSPDDHLAALRLAYHFLLLAQSADSHQRYLDLDPDWPHLRAALHFAADNLPPLLSQLTLALDPYFSARGLARERAAWARKAADASASLPALQPHLPLHLAHLGQAHADLGNPQRAIEIYGQALPLARANHLPAAEAHLLTLLGQAYADLGDAHRAILFYHQALELSDQPQDRRAHAALLASLGHAHQLLGHPNHAIPFYQQALAIAREAHDQRTEANLLALLGQAHSSLADPHQAISCHKQALPLLRTIGDRQGETLALGLLGRAYADLSQFSRAIDTFEQALELALLTGDLRARALQLDNLGLAYAALNDPLRAAHHFRQALDLFQQAADRRSQGACLGHLARAHLDLGDLPLAIDTFHHALSIAQDLGDRPHQADWLGNLGTAYAYQGDLPLAVAAYEAALALHQETGDRRAQASWLSNLGQIALLQNEPDHARSLWSQALQILQALKDPAAGQVLAWLKELDNKPPLEAAPAHFHPVGTSRPAPAGEGQPLQQRELSLADK